MPTRGIENEPVALLNVDHREAQHPIFAKAEFALHRCSEPVEASTNDREGCLAVHKLDVHYRLTKSECENFHVFELGKHVVIIDVGDVLEVEVQKLFEITKQSGHGKLPHTPNPN